MNWLDIVVLVFLAISTLYGLKNGLIKAVLSLAGIVVGVMLAVKFYVPLAERLTFISSETIARIVAFAIILVGIGVIARLIAWLLEKVASVLMVGWLNRIGGAVFGLVLGAMLLGTLLAVWVRYFGIFDIITESRIASFLLNLPLLPSLIPGDGIPSPF